jgi:hypothetical protein
MRYAAWLLIVAACGKGGGKTKLDERVDNTKLAPADEARIIARDLAKAMTACDEGQLAGFLDFTYLAARAGGEGTFLQEASKQRLDCKSPSSQLTAAVVDRPGAAKPLIRWRKGTGCSASFGYLELTVAAASPAPRIADLGTPLHPPDAVAALRNIRSQPAADQPGMIADSFISPFQGVGTGGRYILRLRDLPSVPAVPEENLKRGDKYGANLALAIDNGFIAHDYKDVQVAANAAAKLVGEDAQLASVRVAAALGAGDSADAQKLARDATAKWPDDIDAWCARFDAELAAGDAAAMTEAKQTLATKFKVER